MRAAGTSPHPSEESAFKRCEEKRLGHTKNDDEEQRQRDHVVGPEQTEREVDLRTDAAGLRERLHQHDQFPGEREGSAARLEEAVVAYRKALEECTRERVPLD